MATDTTPPDETPADEPPRMQRSHRRRVLRIILVTHLCLALLTGVGVAVAYHQVSGNIEALPAVPDSVDRPDPVMVDGPEQPINILVMGSDTRAGEGNKIDGMSGVGQRSDTTILVHVSADRKDAYGVSLPRDALVDRPKCVKADGETIPGEGLAMFNEAFSIGGPLCTVQMVEALTNVRIDHQIVVDFNGFKDMVDAVDGVDVCLPKAVDDPERDIFLDAGKQTLTGQDALDYVRERYVLSVTGDIGRMKRQQAFIASMINKVVSAGTLARPDRVFAFLDAATSSLMLDKELANLPAMVDLALEFRNTGLSKIRFVTVPFEEYAAEPGRLVWTDEANTLWGRIRRDQPLGGEFSDDSLSADDPVGTASGSASGDTSPKPEGKKDATDRLAAGLCV